MLEESCEISVSSLQVENPCETGTVLESDGSSSFWSNAYRRDCYVSTYVPFLCACLNIQSIGSFA